MKVITKQATATVTFNDVAPGQIFIYNDDEVYMKLDSAYRSCDERGYEDATWSAVHLESGELCEFDAYHAVIIPHRVTPMEVIW